MPHTVVLIPGDGIGPEVARATRRVLEAAGAPVVFLERFAGEIADLARTEEDVLTYAMFPSLGRPFLAKKYGVQ